MSDYAQQLDNAIAQAMGLWMRDYPTAWPVIHAFEGNYVGDGGKLLEPWVANMDQTWLNYTHGRLAACARVNYQEEAIVKAIESDRVLLMREVHKQYSEGSSRMEQIQQRVDLVHRFFTEEAAKSSVPLIRLE